MLGVLLSLVERAVREIDPAPVLGRCRKVLMIDPAVIGDMVRSTPAYRAVKEQIPGVRVEALIFEAGRPVFRHNPHADAVHAVPRNSLAGQIAAAIRLRREGYDAIINLYTGLRFNVLAFLIGAPLRVGYNYRHRGCLHNRRVPIATRTVQTAYRPEECVSLLERAFGWTIRRRSMEFALFESDRAAADAALARLGVAAETPIVGFHVVSGSRPEEKRWGAEQFAGLADELIGRYGVTVVFTGTPADAPAIDGVLARIRRRERAVSTAGLLNLSQLGALISRCALYVSLDSGPLHISIAVGTPTFALVGGVHLGLVVPEGERKFQGIAAGYPGQTPFRPLSAVPLAEVARHIHDMAASLELFPSAGASGGTEGRHDDHPHQRRIT